MENIENEVFITFFRESEISKYFARSYLRDLSNKKLKDFTNLQKTLEIAKIYPFENLFPFKVQRNLRKNYKCVQKF